MNTQKNYLVLGFMLVLLTACGGGGGSNNNSAGSPTQNQLPTASTAGTQTDVFFTDTVTLDGSSSSDSDGDTLTYQWQQTSGPAITLTNSDSAQASFTAPSSVDGLVLVFELVVNDGTGNSTPASVTVVSRQYPIPIGSASTDTSAASEGDVVTLDASGSSDPQGEALTYQWTQTAGPAVLLSDDTAAQPTFTAGDVFTDETLTFRLIVTNTRRSSSPVFVDVEVSSSTGVLAEFPNPLKNSYEYFAESIAAVDNNTVLVGVPSHKVSTNNVGLAYLVNMQSKTVITMIESPEVNDRYFGKHVDVMPNGDYIISSMNNGGTDTGSVFIFDEVTRALKLTLNHPDPEGSDNFGEKFAILPDGRVAVSARQRNVISGGIFNGAGIVYLFDPATCDSTDGSTDQVCSSHERSINHPELESNNFFGAAIAATPDGNLIISAHGHTVGGEAGAGTVYVIDPDTDTLILSIDNPAPLAGDWFGTAIATTPSGNIIVGGYQDDGDVANSGKVYVFNSTGLVLVTLSEPPLSDGARFGWAVASDSNDNIVVGAPFNEVANPQGGDGINGTVFVFDATSGALLASVDNPLASDIASSGFGGSLAVPPSDNIFVGAPQAGDDGNIDLPKASGAVYLVKGP